jgi:hypothetical protein
MDLIEKIEEDEDAVPATTTTATEQSLSLATTGPSKSLSDSGDNGNGIIKEEIQSLIGDLIEIPKIKLLDMLGGCGIDSNGIECVPVWAVDPYPAQQTADIMIKHGQTEKSPMTKTMFDWLAKRYVYTFTIYIKVVTFFLHCIHSLTCSCYCI